MHKLVLLVAALLIATPAIASANLLSDVGFEGAGAGPWGGWASTGFTRDFDATPGRAGQALKMSYDTSASWTSAIATQDCSVTVGQNWYAEVYAKVTDALDGGNAYLETIYLKSDLTPLAESTKLKSAELSAVVDWTKLTNSGVVPSDAAWARYQLVTLHWNSTADIGTAYFDDGLAVVPEPTSLLLLGSGLIGLLSFAGRKR